MRTAFAAFLILSSSLTVAQGLDTLKFENSREDLPCSEMAKVSAAALPSLRYTDLNDIRSVVADWERSCGVSEPLLRVKILAQIQRGLRCEGLVQKFIPEYYSEFRLRVGDYVPLDIYDFDPERYGFVPFESPLDTWTEEWALSLIDKLPYGTDEFLACALFTGNVDRFDELLSSGDFNETLTWRMMDERSKDRWDPLFGGGLHMGYWQPVGPLTSAFGGTIELGGSLGSLINRTSGVRVEATLKLRPMVNRDGLYILVGNRFENTRARACFSIGGQVIKSIPLKRGFFIDAGAGVEYISLSTDLTKVQASPGDEESTYSVNTYNVFSKMAIMKALPNNSRLGVYVTTNYAPFNNDRDLGRAIGDTFLGIGLEYRPMSK